MNLNKNPEVFYVPIPYGVMAATAPNDNGKTDIFINSDLTEAQRQKALAWALDIISNAQRKGGVVQSAADIVTVSNEIPVID